MRPRYSEMDKAYISKFFHIDGPQSLGYALNRKYQSIQRTYDKIIKSGKLNYYIQMRDEQFKG